jgi:hypothetical protein
MYIPTRSRKPASPLQLVLYYCMFPFAEGSRETEGNQRNGLLFFLSFKR